MRPDQDEDAAASDRLDAGPALEAMLARLGARAGRQAKPRPRGDHDLDPAMRPSAPLTPAAVLVPIIAHAQGPTVLFERRAPALADHAGEICFPGGRFEDVDRTPEQAALRELEEELGLAPSLVRIVGLLDAYETRTGFRVFPVVGVIRPPILVHPDPVEVAEAFEVPLAHLLEPANYLVHRVRAGEALRTFRAVPYHDYFIWGATAGMLMNLCEWLREP